VVQDGMGPDGDVAKAFQPNLPMTKATIDMELSSDELDDVDDDQDLVSFNDIMDAADCAVD